MIASGKGDFGAGGDLLLTSGAGSDVSNGGSVSVGGGDALGSGIGGQVLLSGGSSAEDVGGSVLMEGGASSLSAAGGSVILSVVQAYQYPFLVLSVGSAKSAGGDVSIVAGSGDVSGSVAVSSGVQVSMEDVRSTASFTGYSTVENW